MFTSLLLVGCSSSQSVQKWENQQGGICHNNNLQLRVNAIVGRLISDDSDDSNERLRAYVLNSDAACAFALPDRSIYVTRGLLNRCDDNLVAAAIAHELGHLMNDGYLNDTVSINGAETPGGVEGRADAYGLELLKRKQIPADSMIRMLYIVRENNSLPASNLRDINQRIACLSRLDSQ